MKSNRQVICAGCSCTYKIPETQFYRNKRWCGNSLCKEVIDYKVKHANYKKSQKKMQNGTFRHGVESILRNKIKNRDDFTCRLCMNKKDSNSLQVHHITPVSNGGNDELSNLVLLCHNCHTSLHQEGWEKYSNKLFLYTNSLEKQKV
jgi:5-methylcytosine-specific restriction endonuclease McrA